MGSLESLVRSPRSGKRLFEGRKAESGALLHPKHTLTIGRMDVFWPQHTSSISLVPESAQQLLTGGAGDGKFPDKPGRKKYTQAPASSLLGATDQKESEG